MTTNPRYAGGEEGYIGIADEWDPGDAGKPGTFAAPTQFLMAETDSLDSQATNIVRDVYGGGADSDQGYRTGKYTVGGGIGIALYPTNGELLRRKAIGKSVALTAVTADTAASVDTTGPNPVITLTTGGAADAYQKGQIVLLDSEPTQEPSFVLDWDHTTKELTVPPFEYTHTGTFAVVAPAQTLEQPYTRTDGYGRQLGTVSLEENVGGKYSWRYSNGRVGKWSLKASASKFEVSADVMFNNQRALANGQDGNPSPTEFDDSDPTWEELGFEFTDGFLVFPVDPDDTGSAVLQLAADGQDWELEINNNLKAENCYDRSEAIRHFPMNRQVTLKWKMLNAASRPVAWTDFYKKNLDVPFFAYGRLNKTGDPTNPKWQVIVFYAPTCRMTKATEIKGIKDVVGESIEATARRGAGVEKIYVFTLDQS